MGLAKIAPDGWAYYASEVAAGVEDYFVGGGEESGRWMGRGAKAVGLSGEIDSDGLAMLFGQGRHPVTGEVLGHPFSPERTAVAGFALSFSPPKSVSVLWALASDDVSGQVRMANDAAVSSALRFLQDQAAFTRRGRGGTVQEASGGFVAARFVHRTSRAGDPQLHSHVLVANKVQAVSDGRWLSVDDRELFEVQKAAGKLYKAAVRAELTDRLGVAWSDVDVDGGAEIVGVPESLIAGFSKRRAQVEAAGARLAGERETALGRSLTADERAAVFQLAAYQSRAAKRKDGGETTGQLRARWRSEAAAAGGGGGPERWLGGVFALREANRREIVLSRLGLQPSPELLVSEVIDLLERRHSTWGRAQVVEAVTTVLPTGRLGSASELRRAVEAATDMVLASREVVSLSCPDRPGARHGGVRYSTWWTLQTEQAILDVVEGGRTASVAVAAEGDVEAAVAGLGGDQADAVRRVCGGGDRVAVMVGPAGSGKSASLAAARHAWEASGVTVRGVAPSAVVAGVLTEQAGIRSDTLAKFLADAADRRARLARGEVVVCDEASMVSTRDLARLVLLAESSEAKVVLVGDHLQLGSVDAGGLFRLLAADARTVELTGVRRFADPWEADASRRLRAGDRSVIDEYTDRDRARSGDRDAALDAAHQAWLDSRRDGRSVVVMAADHDTVDQLAMRARAARVAAGQVEPAGIAVAGQTVGVGDEIVTTRNDRRLVTTTGGWVRNGDRWTVTARTPAGALQLASLDGRGTVTLPSSYVDQQHVGLAYAVTVHKGQGLTVDQGVLVVDRATSAEHLYVGMTRGRHHNLACAVTEPSGDEHTPSRAPTPSEVLTAALGRTSSQKSATETIRDELDQVAPETRQEHRNAIINGLRQAQQHRYEQTVRRHARSRPSIHPRFSPAPAALRRGPDL